MQSHLSLSLSLSLWTLRPGQSSVDYGNTKITQHALKDEINIALNETVNWCTVVWYTQNVHQHGSFAWHQPCNTK